jgi:hypothetical protein
MFISQLNILIIVLLLPSSAPKIQEHTNDDVAAPPLAHVTTATYLWLIDGSLAR